jgi:hypothetical protein
MANFERHPKGTQEAIDLVHTFLFEAVCSEMDADPSPGAVETFTVLIDLTTASARMDLKSVRRLGHVLKVICLYTHLPLYLYTHLPLCLHTHLPLYLYTHRITVLLDLTTASVRMDLKSVRRLGSVLKVRVYKTRGTYSYRPQGESIQDTGHLLLSSSR